MVWDFFERKKFKKGGVQPFYWKRSEKGGVQLFHRKKVEKSSLFSHLCEEKIWPQLAVVRQLLAHSEFSHPLHAINMIKIWYILDRSIYSTSTICIVYIYKHVNIHKRKFTYTYAYFYREISQFRKNVSIYQKLIIIIM